MPTPLKARGSWPLSRSPSGCPSPVVPVPAQGQRGLNAFLYKTRPSPMFWYGFCCFASFVGVLLLFLPHPMSFAHSILSATTALVAALSQNATNGLSLWGTAAAPQLPYFLPGSVCTSLPTPRLGCGVEANPSLASLVRKSIPLESLGDQ